MKKILTLALLAISTGASSQTMYKMESLPIYDSLGNAYQTRQVFDHLPTHDDSVAFQREVKSYIRSIEIVHKRKRNVRLYPAVVSEVRNKKGHIAIRPTTRFKSPWYRYNDPSVKVGDTIWISREDAIEPRF